MTEEKNPQEWRYPEDYRSESLENTRANSQENKSPDDSLGWKTGEGKVMIPAIICFAYLLADETLGQILFWLPFCFMLLGSILHGGLREQRYRIQALEAALAELKQKPTE